MTDSTTPTAERTRIVTDDGVELGVTRTAPAGATRASILVASATAVPRGFYRRFAEHAAKAGYEVLTMDYRGTGESRPTSLRGYEMTFADWAEHDIPAGIEALRADRPRYLVGHSYGGSALGLVPGTERLAAAYTFGSGTGWGGWMSPAERRRVRVLWAFAGALTAVMGYAPWSRLGGGEDLPAGAFRQWRRWTGFPRFVVDDPLVPDAAARYASVRIPLTYATAVDDPWATPRARDETLACYTGAASRTAVDLHPSDIGVEQIGHMGYFRAGAEAFWDDVLATFGA
ncbi:MAG: alpha/beta fold hydrolase [Microbacteriaceae bacterium]|nr:alpha/beta fold hydrolase [Microbacteriaceae bacterium]